ncbi:hypothetical protein [Paractinoplanes rishiriensis]|uniref:Uncharacterized protein n=1 Tax=Paractinoplanes rishiriensis TaxID=1050105 RepID=A0A919JXE9_9ACTN|nr:hypothetical protein [Actinoplanes rishiriensis]GIE95014.1 hypothetical protein Ari01nite_24790 [Actinoplanes rishiriensis]
MGRLVRVEGLVAVAGLAAFLMIFGGLGGASDPAPEARWVGLGVLVAPALMAYAHRGAAAWAGVLAAVVWTSLAGSVATALVSWTYALVAIVLTRRDRSPATSAVPLRQPPSPPGLPNVAVPAEVGGFALLLLAVGGLVRVLTGGPVSWLAAVIAAFGLGCALLARVVRHRAELRKLFGTLQPVHTVRAVEQLGYVHVLLPEPGGVTALEFAFDVAEPDRPAEADEPQTRPGVLYGDPRPGAWCAVEVEGRLHVPVGPVGDVLEVGYDVVQGLPREIEDDEEQLVDPAALRPADRGVAAFECREHRIAPPRAWAATAAIGLGAALAAGELALLAGGTAATLAAAATVAAAAGYEFGWRTQLRPRLRWHAGGVAAVGFRGPDRQPWATDSAVVHDDSGTVVLTAGESVLTVPVPPPWPSAESQRNADQLVAALRDARSQSFEISPLQPPPEIEVPRRPVALYLSWLASVVLTVLILG